MKKYINTYAKDETIFICQKLDNRILGILREISDDTWTGANGTSTFGTMATTKQQYMKDNSAYTYFYYDINNIEISISQEPDHKSKFALFDPNGNIRGIAFYKTINWYVLNKLGSEFTFVNFSDLANYFSAYTIYEIQ
jgi:hypothetical protein